MTQSARRGLEAVRPAFLYFTLARIIAEIIRTEIMQWLW